MLQCRHCLQFCHNRAPHHSLFILSRSDQAPLLPNSGFYHDLLFVEVSELDGIV